MPKAQGESRYYVVLRHTGEHQPGEVLEHTPEDEEHGINAEVLVERGSLRPAGKDDDTSVSLRWGDSRHYVHREIPVVPVDGVNMIVPAAPEPAKPAKGKGTRKRGGSRARAK